MSQMWHAHTTDQHGTRLRCGTAAREATLVQTDFIFFLYNIKHKIHVFCWLCGRKCDVNKHGLNLFLCIILAERKGATHERKNTVKISAFQQQRQILYAQVGLDWTLSSISYNECNSTFTTKKKYFMFLSQLSDNFFSIHAVILNYKTLTFLYTYILL